MEVTKNRRNPLSPVTPVRTAGFETIYKAPHPKPLPPQAKRTLPPGAIQEKAGQHGPWRSSL